MKPCATNRKEIALLAADALDSASTQRLRDHFEGCPACQRHWEEISQICREQTQAGSALPEVRADAAFHNRLVRQIANDQQRAIPARLAEALSLWLGSWKAVVPAAVMVLLLMLIFFRSPKEGDPIVEVQVKRGPSNSAARSDPVPSLSAYRLALSRSFEDLDTLLDKNVAHRSTALEPITIAALSRLNSEWP